jgi:hypothetical protein
MFSMYWTNTSYNQDKMKELFVTTGDKSVKHIEGDVWDERGKTWTIKNGIKRTVSKLDYARKEFSTPLACPNCGKSMKHHLDEKMWAIHKTCFNCVIDMEHAIMKTGKYDEYVKNKIIANAEGFVKDYESYINDYMQESVSNVHVTEDGQIEKWKNADQSQVEEMKVTAIKDLTEKIEDYKNK